MKLFMLWDLEGVSGLHRRHEAWFWEPGATPDDQERGRRLLMADIEASVTAALDAGADEVIVCDTHHGGGNMLIAEMPADPRVTYLGSARGEQDGQRRWMPGLDDTVAGFLVPGHHARAGTRRAFLPHTWMGSWRDFRLNGESVGEMAIEACFAGHWGIPVIYAQGDEAACREAETMFAGIVTAAVKRARSPNLCVGPEPAEARRLASAKVAEAVHRLQAGDCRPYQPPLPLTVTIQMATTEQADDAARRPGVVRVDERTVERRVERQADVVQWIVGAGLDMSG